MNQASQGGPPNHRLQVTAYSVRLFLASASSRT